MKITKTPFGTTKNGETATLYTVTNNMGMKVSFTDYGANIVSIIVPDKEGEFEDIALGFKSIGGYEVNGPGFGSLIGRCANRIGGARFELNGKEYTLEKNEGKNNLHSGSPAYNKVMYETEIYEEEDMVSIEFSRLSPHMEQGFPGNLDLTVTYSLTENNELVIEYHAVSDMDTVVNMTNHSYFNLSGHNSGSILDHKVWIKANQFTPTSDDLIPTGEYRDVEGTPMDFRQLKRIGDNIDDDYEPLKQAGGYDHNYVLDISRDEVEKVAELVDESTGRVMEIFTDKPGMQFYTANMLTPVEDGKDGATYGKRTGVCFETQHFPNACNINTFPNSILKAGQEYEYVTIYKFTCR
ncbi:MAG: galactose mutarotase [Clostridiales bacterium]|jgi:aldose 1-epimerase|nr:galactose mutarotase [Clostridiales bacterium]